MNVVDATLRTASVATLLLLLFQIFFSKGGSRAHVLMGKLALCLGVVIVATVSIRGAQQEVLTPLYLLHLATGAPFFVLFFLTIFWGFKARKDSTFARRHRRAGRGTFWLLIATVTIGVVSVLY